MTSDELKSARKRLGLSQAQLAQELGMKTSRSIRRMEKGDSPIHRRTEVTVEKLLADRGLALAALAKDADDG